MQSEPRPVQQVDSWSSPWIFECVNSPAARRLRHIPFPRATFYRRSRARGQLQQGLVDSLLNEFAVQHKTAFRWTCRYHMKGSSSLELIKLASTAHNLPHAVVQSLGFAVRPGNKQYLHSPFDVRPVTIRFCELEIA